MPNGIERRQHRRWELSCPIRIDAEQTKLSGRTANISDGGVFVPALSDSCLATGSSVDVTLSVPRKTPNTYMLEEFRCQARVVRSGSDAAPGGLALQFTQPLAINVI